MAAARDSEPPNVPSSVTARALLSSPIKENPMRNPIVALGSMAAIVATLIVAVPARADLAPPDHCTAPGQPCQNAGPQFNQAGTCTATTCTRQVPAPDGGMMPMSYDCN